MKIKDLKIGIVITMALAVIGAPTIKASAAEVSSKDILDMTQREYTQFLKDEFKEEYGTKDEFITIFEDENAKEEVNPKTTEFKTTNKTTKEVDSYNYFGSLDERVRVSEMNKEESIKYVQEQVNQAKEDFQKQYGTKNEFKTVYEDGNVKEEVNGKTGEYRTTDKKTKEVSVYNYFDELNQEVKNVN